MYKSGNSDSGHYWVEKKQFGSWWHINDNKIRQITGNVCTTSSKQSCFVLYQQNE